MVDVAFVLTAFVSIFAIVDPIAVVPFFTSLTSGYTKAEKKKVIMDCVLVAFLTLMLFAVGGSYIFKLFGFSLPAFEIAGGVLLFVIGFEMLHGEKSKTRITEKDKEEALAREEVGIVPLGIPLLAGPGAIMTVMIYISYHPFSQDPWNVIAVLLCIPAVMALAYVFLTFADFFFARLGRMGALAISRIMGLLLAAVGVQFILNGAQAVYLEFLHAA